MTRPPEPSNEADVAVTPRRRARRRTTVLMLLGLAAAMLVGVGVWQFYLHDVNRVPGEDETITDQAFRLENRFDIDAVLALPDGAQITFTYGPHSDSGVEVTKLDRPGGKVVWTHNCKPLYVNHSEYQHEAWVIPEGSTLKVVSRGSQGSFLERLDADTGELLARNERKQRYRASLLYRMISWLRFR